MAEKKKLTLEYQINSSPKILYGFISEPKGLSQWFADEVEFKDQIYSFIWDGEAHRAKLAASKENKLIRFAWLNDDPQYFFEMEILQDELTNEVGLVITDHVAPEDMDERKFIWQSQIQYLIRVLGA